jgi:hypothetical protein
MAASATLIALIGKESVAIHVSAEAAAKELLVIAPAILK